MGLKAIIKVNNKSIISFLILFFIVNMSPILASNNYLNVVQTKDTVQITVFDNFMIKDESENITSIKNSNWLAFQSNNLSTTYQSVESYYLDFSAYGNVTDIQIDLTFNYNFNSINDKGMFFLNLITNFDRNKEEYCNSTNQIAMSGFYNWIYRQRYVMESYLFSEVAKYIENFSLVDVLQFQIKKTNRIIECSIKDSYNNTLLSKEWNSEFNYVNVNGIILWYSSSRNSNFSLNATSINVDMVIENRDWIVLAKRDRVTYYTISIVGSILGVSFVFLSVGAFVKVVRKNQQEKIARKNRQEKRAKEALILAESEKWIR